MDALLVRTIRSKGMWDTKSEGDQEGRGFETLQRLLSERMLADLVSGLVVATTTGEKVSVIRSRSSTSLILCPSSFLPNQRTSATRSDFARTERHEPLRLLARSRTDDNRFIQRHLLDLLHRRAHDRLLRLGLDLDEDVVLRARRDHLRLHLRDGLGRRGGSSRLVSSGQSARSRNVVVLRCLVVLLDVVVRFRLLDRKSVV